MLEVKLFTFSLLCGSISVVQPERILFQMTPKMHTTGVKLLAEEMAKKGHDVWLAVHAIDQSKFVGDGLEDRGINILVHGDVNSTLVRDLDEATRSHLSMSEDDSSFLEKILNIVKFIPPIEVLARSILDDADAMKTIRQNPPDFIFFNTLPFLTGSFMVPLTLNARFGYWSGQYTPSVVPSFQSSWAPAPHLHYTAEMSFPERFVNTASLTLIDTLVNYYMKTQLSRNNLPVSDLASIRRQSEITVLDVDYILDYPYPYPPNVIPAACLQCRPGKALDGDLGAFVDLSDKDIVYVAFGSFYKVIPKIIYQAIEHAVSALPNVNFIVIHKGKRLNAPNVYEAPHAPQLDVLANEKVRVFVSHCGTNSQYEGVYHGKVIVCLPSSADQFHNGARQVYHGAGRSEDYNVLTPQYFVEVLQDVLHNSSYSEAAKRLSLRFRDMPQTPLERAAHWLDYVVRHGGKHLQWKGERLSWYQSSSLDVYSVVLVVLCLVCCLVFRVSCVCLRLCCGRCCGRRKSHAKHD